MGEILTAKRTFGHNNRAAGRADANRELYEQVRRASQDDLGNEAAASEIVFADPSPAASARRSLCSAPNEDGA
jgi:hypothetical protein